MSRLSKAAKVVRENEKLRASEIVTNFMGGDSYKLDPLMTLRIVASSSIFGEPSYYRSNVKEKEFHYTPLASSPDPLERIMSKIYDGKTTTQIFTETIDAALDFDFEGTLKLAVELRSFYNMRLNPQVIMVRASIHPKRTEWTQKNPGKFTEYEDKVMSRADEPLTQLAYFIALNKGKSKMPTILKKSVAKKLGSLNLYEVNKYKNHEIGMINAVRLVHANSPIIDELMKTGKVAVPDEKKTWEQMKSDGKSWREILSTIKLGHMALLRNLRNIFTDIDDLDLCKSLLTVLKAGVLEGKQFPFRYWSAYKAISSAEDLHHKPQILDALEECIDISVANMPKFSGKTMCLSDNSGSAWGTIPTEYGSVTIAEIDNLSSIITAACSDEGTVGKFGDRLIEFPVSKRNGILTQLKEITKELHSDVGGGTENGIWLFFKDAIAKKKVYDNVVIYSDMQAGTGQLYGEFPREYADFSIHGGRYINVYKLILEYRKKVNPKCNFYCCQTSGYNNVLVPQMSYRTAILSGWTGRESEFMKAYGDIWDYIDKNGN